MKIEIIEKKFNNIILRKILKSYYYYKITLNSSKDGERIIHKNIFEIKSFLTHSDEGFIFKNYDVDFSIYDFKINNIEEYISLKNNSRRTVLLNDINLENYYPMQAVKGKNDEVKLMLCDYNSLTVIDILDKEYGYCYLSYLIQKQNQEALFLGKSRWFEVIYFVFVTPIITFILPLLASVYSKGGFYKNYTTSLYFFLFFLFSAHLIGLSSFLKEYRNFFFRLLCLRRKGKFYVYFKLFLLYFGMMISIVLSYFLGIPFEMLKIFFLSITTLFYLPLLIVIMIL